MQKLVKAEVTTEESSDDPEDQDIYASAHPKVTKYQDSESSDHPELIEYQEAESSSNT